MRPNLEIYFGHLKKETFAVDVCFDSFYEDWWLDNEIADGILKDICNMTKREGGAITVNWYGEGKYVTISPKGLPGGVKALLIMLNTDEVVQGCRCGDNCAKWILEISKKKRLRIALSSFMAFGVDFDAYILNDKTETHSYGEYILKSAEFLNKEYVPGMERYGTIDE